MSRSRLRNRLMRRKSKSDRITHNLDESYLQSLTEEQRIKEMSEWNATEWQQYLCPNGTMTSDEFLSLGYKLINEEYDRLGWK